MAHALHRAAPAILASGTTVIIGLLCLAFAQMSSTAGLGPVGAAGIAIALVLMVVLLPALLVICGRWVFWPFIPHFGGPEKCESGLWGRVGHGIAKAPRAVWVATTLVLLALSLGIVKLDATGLSNAESFTTEQSSVVADTKIAEHFPAGAGDPVQIIATQEAGYGRIVARNGMLNASRFFSVDVPDGRPVRTSCPGRSRSFGCHPSRAHSPGRQVRWGCRPR